MSTYDSPLILKSSHRYLFWRFYAAIGILVFWASCLGSMLVQGWLNGIIVTVGLIVGTPAIFLILNGFAFPWSYSVFGPYERRSIPAQPPEQVLWCSWGAVGELHNSWPLVTWGFFRDGIGIDMALTGRAYLPADCMIRMEKRSLGRYVLHHNCVELRSPVVMPFRAYSAMLASLAPEYRGRLAIV